jgi:NADPH:quinone reductase-like Zn-dependent oxidoreductase
MKAVVYTEFGPPQVLRLKEVEKPSPKDDEILIRVRAVPINYGDLLARNMKAVGPGEFNMPLLFWIGSRVYFGLRKPKIPILGSEFAGEIEAVGPGVSQFKPGDQVYGYRGQSMGAYAEYLCMPADGTVALKPANMSYEEAAGVPMGAMFALDILKRVDIQPGQEVLINGASGGIGSAALQLAKNHFGAKVTGVCGTPRLELLRSLGADAVIDYTQEDFTQSGDTYDVIFDILGKSSFSHCRNALTENGIYLLASFKMRQLAQMLWTRFASSKKVVCALANDRAEDLAFIKELVEAGKLKAIVDKSFPFEQAAEAHRYAESGQKTGNVVITMA